MSSATLPDAFCGTAATSDASHQLRATFGSQLVGWQRVGDVRTMGFSGATIELLQVELDDGPIQRLILKTTSKQAPALGPLNGDEADAATRLRAERTDLSYANECAFLKTNAAALLAKGVRVPRPLRVEEAAGSFSILQEAILPADGWEQHFVIPAGSRTRTVLRWLARFHAAFLPPAIGGGGLPLLTPGACTHGTHLALEKRPAGELATLPATLAAFLEVGT